MQILNPLSLDLPTFLAAYALGSSVLLLVGFVLRWRQTIDRSAPTSTPELNEYQVAYLAGGKVRAIDTARIKLIRCEHNYKDRPLEKAVAEVDDLRWVAGESVDFAIAELDRELQFLGLIYPDTQSKLVKRWLWMLPIWGMVGLGFFKIMAHLSTDGSVIGLAMMWLLSIVAASNLVATPHRTSAGERRLRELEQCYAHLSQIEILNNLKQTQSIKFGNLNGAQRIDRLLLAFALFGKPVLAAKPYQRARNIIDPPPIHSYSSSGDSSGFDGDGDGGCGGDGGGCGD